jgi:hypothetical protein
MWDLIGSIFGAVYDLFKIVISFLWESFVWLFFVMIDVFIWAFKNLVLFYLNIIYDLIVNFPLSFFISFSLLAIGYFLVKALCKKIGLVSKSFLQKPEFIFMVCFPLVTLFVGAIAESGPVSIVNNTSNLITVGGSVNGGSIVQAGSGSGEGGFLGIPTAVWSAIISALATVFASLIALRGVEKNVIKIIINISAFSHFDFQCLVASKILR